LCAHLGCQEIISDIFIGYGGLMSQGYNER
jgi:hypothetical protein